MSNLMMNCRSLLKSGVGLAAAGALGNTAYAQAETKLRMYWWGSKERADRTDAVNKLYSTPTRTSRSRARPWAGTTTGQAGDPGLRPQRPDVIQMDYRYIFEYARRDALLHLDPYMRQGPEPLRFRHRKPSKRQGGRQDLRRQPGHELHGHDGQRQRDRELGLKAPRWR